MVYPRCLHGGGRGNEPRFACKMAIKLASLCLFLPASCYLLRLLVQFDLLHAAVSDAVFIDNCKLLYDNICTFMCNHSYVLVLQFRSTPELQSLRPASEGLELEIDSQLLTQVC